MKSLLVITCLLAAPWLQEKTQTKPPPQSDAARNAALEAIKNAQNVQGERTVTAGSTSRTTDTVGNTATRSSDGSVSGSRTASPGPRSSAEKTSPGARTGAPAPKPVTANKVSEADKKASMLFVSNSLYQQELANRKQVISVEDITTPEAALAELEAGNIRFVIGGRVRTLMTAQEPDLRTSLVKGQAPFAVIVTCSDSRAMDNLIFDQELGRIFTIRVAGNSPDTLGLASIEYAVEYLGSKIVIIMGHTKCGAVGAVAESQGETLPGNLYIFQELMAGLLDNVTRDPNETEADYRGRLEKENAKRQTQAVYDHSEIVREFVDHKNVWLIPASYDLATGMVTFFNRIESNHHEDDSHEIEGDSHSEPDSSNDEVLIVLETRTS